MRTSVNRSEQLDLQEYDTDKVRNGYLRWYDDLFNDTYDRVKAVLELGVHRGGSLELWRDYFPAARIVGIDTDISAVRCADPRIEFFQGRQDDERFLQEIARRAAPDGFDLIIDDASHIGALTEATFRALYDAHLKPGGFYVIEDWGTGYLPDWPDGKKMRSRRPPMRSRSRLAHFLGVKLPIHSHLYGLVGFIKRLVDEQGQGRFAQMTITSGLVALRKPG